MGISIHYSGKIANKQKLPELIEEVQEIAIVHGWEYKIYESAFPTTILLNQKHSHNGLMYGIDFTPKGCEPIAVCFLSNGKMSNIMQLAYWGNFEKESILTTETETWDDNGNHSCSTDETILDQAEYEKLLCMCSAKTQYASAAVHELIIGVLRYISNAYLTDFKLTDEGQFWETGDSTLLQKNFERNGFLIQSFSETINNEQRLHNEDINAFIKRIINNFRKKNDVDENAKHSDNENE